MNFSKFRTPLEIAGLSGGVGASALAIQYSQERNTVNEENKKFKEENRELMDDIRDLKQENIDLGSIIEENKDSIKKAIEKINTSRDSLKTVTNIYRIADSNHELIKAADRHIKEITKTTEDLAVS